MTTDTEAREDAWERHKAKIKNSRHRRQASFDDGFDAGLAAARAQQAETHPFIVTDEAVRLAWFEANKPSALGAHWRLLESLNVQVVPEDDPRTMLFHPRPVGWHRLGIDRGWPTPNHMRRTADGLDAMTHAKYGDILRYVADLCEKET